MAANGWLTFNLDGPLTMALPTGLLAPGEEDEDSFDYASRDGSLRLRVIFGTPRNAQAMHAWMLDSHAGPEEPYHSERGDRTVTRIVLDDGQALYLRSARIGGFTISIQVGEPVFALGFPLFGADLTMGQGLSVTGGNISAMPRVLAPGARISVTATIQPGNSGGPLLSDDRAVMGVVVEWANDLAVLAQDGIVPQNMKFATSVAQLVPFLEGAGVLFPSAAERGAQDLSQGIPDEVQAAVELIGCY